MACEVLDDLTRDGTVVRDVTLDDLLLVESLPILRAALATFIAQAGPAVACAPADALAKVVTEASDRCESCRTVLPSWGPDPVRVEGFTTCGSPACVDEIRGDHELARRQEAEMRAARAAAPACESDAAVCPVCGGPLPSHGFVMAAGITYCSWSCSHADRYRRAVQG